MRDVLDAVLVSKLEWSRGPCPPTSPRASGGLAPAHAAESE